MDQPRVPPGLAEITPDWLTSVLHTGRAARGVDATGVEIAHVDVQQIGVERGFTGVVARLRPTYNAPQAGAPTSMIVKLPMADRASLSSYRAAAIADPVFAHRHFARCVAEVQFYRDLAPGLGSWVPDPLYTAVDAHLQQVVLVLPDLTAARPGDALAGATTADVAAVLGRIAGLHATWWNHHSRDRPEWLGTLLTDPGARSHRYRTQIDLVLDRHGNLLTRPARTALLRLRDTVAGSLTHLAAAPATVIHADLHLDNVLFPTGTGGPPVVVLDWQSVAVGPAMVDVAGLIVGSLAPAERRSGEEDLLRHYHAALREHGVVGYPSRQLRADYRLAALRHVAGMLAWVATADPTTTTGRERMLLDAALRDGRLMTALVDLV